MLSTDAELAASRGARPASVQSANDHAEADAQVDIAVDGWAGPANRAACALAVKFEEEQALAAYQVASNASRDPEPEV